MKINNQIKEIEKGCGKDTDFYWGKGKKPSNFYKCGKKHPVVNEIFYCSECKEKLKLLKQFQKEIKEVQEELKNRILDLGILEEFKDLNVSESVDISLDIINNIFKDKFGELKWK